MAESKQRYVRRSTTFNMEGALDIKGGLISSWKKKYFKAVFSPPQLVYYEKKDGKLVERLPFDKDTRLAEAEKGSPKFAFNVIVKNKPYQLSADTEEERKEWTAIITKCINFAKQIAEGTTDGLFSSNANGAPDGDAVLVWGAGSELGALIVNYLLEARIHTYAGLRPEEAEMDKSTARGAGRVPRDLLARRGANVCVIDTKNDKSVDAALRGVNRLILCSAPFVNPLDTPPTPPDYADVIAAEAALIAGAKRASLKVLVRVSSISAASNSTIPLLAANGKCDGLLSTANTPFAILACGIFMQYIAYLHREIKAQGQMFGASGGGQRYGMVDMRDVARAAVTVVTSDALQKQLNSNEGKRYRLVTEVSSDEDIVSHINSAISPTGGNEKKKNDSQISYSDLSDEDYAAQLRKLGVLPEYSLPTIVGIDRIKREGTVQSTRVSTDFNELMAAAGVTLDPKPLNIYIRDHLPMLSDKVAAAGFGLTVLVTGATSSLGQATVQALASRYPTLSGIRAGCRNVEKGNTLFKGLRNVKVVQCDTWKKDALPPAFAGVDAVLLIPPPDKELGDIFTYIQAIKSAKTVKLIAVVDHFCAGDQSRIYGRIWGSIEQEVEKSGIPYCFLRTSFFMENQLIQLSRMKDKGILQWPATADARISHVAVQDVGYSAAAVLVQPTKYANQRLTITGPDAMSFNELAGRFTSVLGKQISYVRCKPDETLHYDYERVYSKWQSDAMLELWEDVNAQKLATVSPDLQTLLGEMKPMSSEQFAKEKIAPFFEEKKEHHHHHVQKSEAKKDASTALLPGGKSETTSSGYGTMSHTLVMNTFRAQQTYTYDLVLVFKVGSPDKKLKMAKLTPQDGGKPKKEILLVVEEEYFRNGIAETIDKLHNSGLQTDMWYSVQKDEIYVRVGASEDRLALEADRSDYDLQLDGQKCLAKAKELNVRLAVLTGKDVPDTAWQNLFGKYDRPNATTPWRHELYQRYHTTSEWADNPHYNSLFTPIDRIKLTSNIIKGDAKLGGAELPIKKMITNPSHPLSAFFPLHSDTLRKPLYAKMTSLRSAFNQPLQDVRDYFGESIAMYFAFLAYYNRALILPAIVGLIFFIDQLGESRIDVDALPVYAIFVALWATLFLEYWKRLEATYRIKWGMSHFLEKEQARPEFKGQWQPSPVDGQLTEIFPWQEKLIRLLISQSVIFSLIAIVIGCVASIFVLRGVMAKAAGASTGNIITSIVNAIQINILNVIYGKVAFKLTEYENHRTETMYENSLIAKTFLFKFVNSYNSMFYVAFLKKYEKGDLACKPDCLSELRIQLATIFITQMIVGNFFELFVPWVNTKLKARANAAKPEDGQVAQKSVPECEFELEPYEGTFVDFDEMVIQFGYVTLFVVAFPITPLLALASNVLEARVDSTKLCLLVRRPEPRGAANIGTWFDILNLVSFIAVMTNAAIVCFETPKMNQWLPHAQDQAFCFLLAEHAILGLKIAIGYFVPDEPADVTVHIMRQEYLVGVLLQGVEEEEDDIAHAAEEEREEDEVVGTGHNHVLDTSIISDSVRKTDHDI